MKKRIRWVDYYKAIAIILIVVAHTTGLLGKPIQHFHGAAFFVISGYLFKCNNENFINYLKRKWKSLINPYIIFVFILSIISILLSRIGDFFYTTPIYSNIIILFLKYLNTVDLAGALWFIPVLFFTEISFKLLYDIYKSSKYNNKNFGYISLVISIIIALWGIYFYYNRGEILSYNFDLVFIALLAYTLGFNIKFYKLESKLNKYNSIVLLIVSILIVYVFDNKFYMFLNWPTRSFPSLIWFILLTCSGSYIIYFISKLLDKIDKKIYSLDYIGQNSLYILAYHFLGFRVLFTILYLLKLVDKAQIQSLTPLYGRNLLYAFITIIFAISFSLIFKNIIDVLKNWCLDFYKKRPNMIIFIGVIIAILFCSWIFDARNFFVFDDYSLLKKVTSNSFMNFFGQIIPEDVYNSRPVGWIIIKIFTKLFGFNFLFHSASLLLIHIVNMILVYYVAKNLFKFSNINALLISIMFAVWPTSTMAFTWDASIYDLFGCTTLLLCLVFYYKVEIAKNNVKKIITIILMLLIYYIGLRTKEMVIALPVILFIYSFYNYVILKKNKLLDYLKKYSYIIVMIVIMFGYFLYTRYLNSLSSITTSIDNPYYYTFSIKVLLTNLFRYIYLFFDFNSISLMYNDGGLLYPVILFTFTFVLAIVDIIKKKDYTLLLLGITFVCIILPVLPMKNMQHILYLYMPSIFLIMIIFNLLSRIVKPSLNYVIIIIFVLFLVVNSEGVITYRNWWLNTTNFDKNTYDYLVSTKGKHKNSKEFCVNNVDESTYYSYFYGPGAIINVAYEDNDIETKINSKDCENAIIIDCKNKCEIVR